MGKRLGVRSDLEQPSCLYSRFSGCQENSYDVGTKEQLIILLVTGSLTYVNRSSLDEAGVSGMVIGIPGSSVAKNGCLEPRTGVVAVQLEEVRWLTTALVLQCRDAGPRPTVLGSPCVWELLGYPLCWGTCRIP